MKCKGLSITCLVLRFLHRLLLDISINFSLLWPLRLHVFLFQDLDDTVSYVTPDLDQFDSSKFSDGENTKMNIKILRMRTSTPSQRCCQLQNNNYPSLLWMVSTSAWEKPFKCIDRYNLGWNRTNKSGDLEVLALKVVLLVWLSILAPEFLDVLCFNGVANERLDHFRYKRVIRRKLRLQVRAVPVEKERLRC